MDKKFINWAKENKWKLELTDENFILPNNIIERYTVSKEWLNFINGVKNCTNSEQNKWFLTMNDYDTEYYKSSWGWNDFEMMSLQAAEDDIKWQEEITEFWNRHFPIFLDVEGDYSYYAIDTDSGEIVQGYEPEFEDCYTVAETFEDFITKILDGKIIL